MSGLFNQIPPKANYRLADPARTRKCGTCAFFTFPAMCSMWHDLVTSGHVCDYWATRKKKGFTSRHG